jgi:hypothetical protein
MEPLVKRKTHPAWLCWVALVHLMKYAARHTFDATQGPRELNRLADELLRRFDAVKEWNQGKGYGKPKLHPPTHFGESLEEVGLLRGVWCFPYEAFLQSLKSIFEMNNGKSACYEVGVFWAVKSVMNYRDPTRGSWHEDTLDPLNDAWSQPDAPQDSSPLLLALLREPDCVIRFRLLRSARRARSRVAVGEWLLLQDSSAGVSIIARVRDMMEVETMSSQPTTVVRLWVDGCCEPREGESGDLWAPKPGMSKCMLVKYECTHITCLQRHIYDAHDVYSI